MDQLMDEQEWARDLFDKAREGKETAWTADVAAISRGGDRRRRLRDVSFGGGVLGVVAVTAAVAVGISGGPTSVGQIHGPDSGGWGGRPLARLFDYVNVASVTGGSQTDSSVVPQSAAQDAASILGVLDPDLSHVRSGIRLDTRVVKNTDGHLRGLLGLSLGGYWTVDGVAPTQGDAVPGQAVGVISIRFGSESDAGWRTAATMLGSGADDLPCGYAPYDVYMATPPKHPTHWTPCRSTTLSDGSKVAVTSTPDGEGTVYFAVREFPGGRSGVTITARNYPQFPAASKDGTPPVGMFTGPDPTTVIKPSPFSEDLLRLALSDPSLQPGFVPPPAPVPAGGFLRPADLGVGWSVNPAGAPTAVDELRMENGCTPSRTISNLVPGAAAQFPGPLPTGHVGTVFEGEYKLPRGTGAATMQLARQQAQGGCGKYSADTATDLPASIGDGFVAYDKSTFGVVVIALRFGDTIVETGVAEGGPVTVPDLSTDTGRAWLDQVAAKVAERWTGK